MISGSLDWKRVFAWIFISSLFFLLNLPEFSRHYFLVDEGFNLIKAFLIEKGFPFFSRIWSDQPPLFSFILWFWFKIWGFSLYAARVLMTFFSLFLLFGVYKTVEKINGKEGGWLAILFLFLSPNFLELSFSVLIGLPSLAFLSFSMFLGISYHENRKPRFFAASLSFFILAAGCKFQVFTALPSLCILWITSANLSQKSRLKNSLAVLSSLCLFWVLFFPWREQLLETHFLARKQLAGMGSGLPWLWFKKQLYAVLPVFCVFPDLFEKHSSKKLSVFLWFFLSSLTLFFHWPVWYHYSLMESVPLVICSGMAFNYLRKLKIKFPVLGILWITLFFLSGNAITQNIKIRDLPKNERKELYREMLNVLKEFPPSFEPVFTDFPLLNFESGKTTIPELAVLSYKRIESGKMNDEYATQILSKYPPEIIMFFSGALVHFQKMNQWIQENYDRLALPSGTVYYRLIKKQDPKPEVPRS